MTQEPDKSLKIGVREEPSRAVVTLEGSVSISEADALRRQLEALADRKIPLIVLDLTGMDFICSAGLGALISAHLKGRHHEGRIVLVNPQPAVRKLLETTRLTKVFPVRKSVELATT